MDSQSTDMKKQASEKKVENRGRPSSYTEEIGDKICDALSNGNSIIQICKRDDMPHESTVYTWRRNHPTFDEKYARARQDQADHYASKITVMADAVAGGKVEPNAARVAIDAWKWAAGKLRPRDYGEKHQLEHSGSIAVPVIMDDIEED